MASLSSWSSRNRRTSSSVRDDFPEPPVPVIPSTGTGCWPNRDRSASAASGSSAPGLDAGDPPGQGAVVARRQRVQRGRGAGGQVAVALLDQEVDHGVEAELLTVGRREDPLHAVGLELLDLGRDDDTASAAVDPDVAPALGPQPVDQVPEVLHVAALVGADGHALDVLGDGRLGHLVHRPVVAEVDDLGPLRLQEPAHDVDGGVVAVEQAGRRHEPDRVHRPVQLGHASVRRRARRGTVRGVTHGARLLQRPTKCRRLAPLGVGGRWR